MKEGQGDRAFAIILRFVGLCLLIVAFAPATAEPGWMGAIWRGVIVFNAIRFVMEPNP